MCVRASSAVRRTSSTSSERLTVSATVCRISRWRSTGGPASAGGGQRSPRAGQRALHRGEVGTRQVAQLGGDTQDQGQLAEVLARLFRLSAPGQPRRRQRGGLQA